MLPVYHAVVGRLFGAAIYGLYATAFGIIEMFTRLSTGGIDLGFLRDIARARARDDEAGVASAIGTGLRAVPLLGIVVGAAVWLLAAPLARLSDKPEIETMLVRLAPVIPIAALTLTFIGATLAAKRMRYHLVVRGVLDPASMLAFCVAGLALFEPSAGLLAAAHLCGAAVTAAVAALACRHLFGARTFARSFTAPFDFGLWRLSWTLGAADLVTTVLQRADLVILGLFVGKKELGLYAGAEFLARAIGNTRYVFDYIACPVLSEAHQAGDRPRMSYNLQLFTRWVLMLAVPLTAFFVVFPADIVGLMGPEFREAATLFIVLSAAHFLNAAFGLTGWVLAMGSRPRLMLVNAIIATVLNIVVNFALIPPHGAIGAAVAAVIGVVALRGLEIAQSLYFERVHAFSFGALKVVIAGAISVAAQMGLLSALTISGVFAIVLCTALGLIVFVVALLVIGGHTERDFLARIARAIPGLRSLVR